ncbi:MAG: FRG domain-containing protein [Acidobacteriota bacterium]
MEEIVVSSWQDVNEQLYKNAWKPDIGRFRSRYAFRGLSTSDYRLETTLSRLRGRPARLEGHLLRNFRKYAHRDVVERDFLWNWMSVAQHHRLPTRLLDWTYSPYVALHFATANTEKFHTDGAVWCVDFARANERLPRKLRDALTAEGADVFTVEMLTRLASRLESFDGLAASPFVVFFEPPSLDDRIINQYALFSVLSDPEAILDDWIVAHPGMGRKLIIPAGLKWEIRDKLDQANISERVLFPGLDGLSGWLKRHYSQRS